MSLLPLSPQHNLVLKCLGDSQWVQWASYVKGLSLCSTFHMCVSRVDISVWLDIPLFFWWCKFGVRSPPRSESPHIMCYRFGLSLWGSDWDVCRRSPPHLAVDYWQFPSFRDKSICFGENFFLIDSSHTWIFFSDHFILKLSSKNRGHFSLPCLQVDDRVTFSFYTSVMVLELFDAFQSDQVCDIELFFLLWLEVGILILNI